MDEKLNTFELDVHDPDLCGTIEFHIPSPVYLKAQALARKSEMMNIGRNDNLRKLNADDFSEYDGRFFEMVSTLEWVIKKAPKGFYAKQPNGKYALQLQNFPSEKIGILATIYNGYVACQERFLADDIKTKTELKERRASANDSGDSEEG